MSLDWATVPILAVPIPTSTSSGAFLLAFAILEGIPPEAGGLDAQPKITNAAHNGKTTVKIFFIKHSLKYFLSQKHTFPCYTSAQIVFQSDA
jgi:hypothetical protein